MLKPLPLHLPFYIPPKIKKSTAPFPEHKKIDFFRLESPVYSPLKKQLFLRGINDSTISHEIKIKPNFFGFGECENKYLCPVLLPERLENRGSLPYTFGAHFIVRLSRVRLKRRNFCLLQHIFTYKSSIFYKFMCVFVKLSMHPAFSFPKLHTFANTKQATEKNV